MNTVKDRMTGLKGIKKARVSTSVDFENPTEKFRKSQQREQMRMTQQSAYTGITGYSCKEIDSTAFKISRKKLILDPYDMPKKKQHPG